MNSKLKEQEITQNDIKTKDYIVEENHCILCGEELIFTHVSHFIKNRIEEEATCPSCGVKNKKKSYTLQ